MTDPIDEIRTLLSPIDPALGRLAPRLQSETILRKILDDPSSSSSPVPASGGFDSVPPGRRPVGSIGPTPRSRRALRRIELVSCLAVIAIVVGAVTLRLNSGVGNAPKPAVAGRTVADRGAPWEAPSGTVPPGAGRLLPSQGASIDRLITYDMPVDSTYQQLFLGTRGINPQQLVVTTVDALQHRSGSRLLSASFPHSDQTVNIGSHRVALRTEKGRTYLWWMQPDGVEVDIAATNLTTSEVVHVLTHATVSRTSRLGLDFAGVLPAGLHPISSVFTNQPGMPLEELDYRQGTCAVQLEVFSNVDGHADPASGTTRWTIVSGHQALITTDRDIVTLVWGPVQGFTTQLSGSTHDGCDVAVLAQQVHRVTPDQWAATFSQLGAKAQRLPATREFR